MPYMPRGDRRFRLQPSHNLRPKRQSSQQDKKKSRLVLTPEAKSYVAAGASPEVQFYNAVPSEGATVKELQVQAAGVNEVSFGQT